MTIPRDQLHLAVALDGTGWHPAAWRLPEARPAELTTAGYWTGLVQEAERGLLDFVTIEDAVSLQSSSRFAPDDRTDHVRGRLDAVLIAARTAPVTSHIGLVPTATVTHTEPFHVSKSIATLDYVSTGRGVWRAQVRLGREDPEFDLLGHLQDLADAVEALVPDCIGLSIAWVDRGTAFTLEATDAEIAVLDAIQYLDGGPCVTVPEVDTGVTWHREDPLDEDIWRMFAQATAHCGVRSTLTMPLVVDGEVVGTANLYAGSDHAFDDHLEALARLLGGAAGDVVRNADLSFSTRGR